MFRYLVPLLLLASPAWAQNYLIYSNQAACLVRSQQMCQTMGCDGVNTIYWWDCGTGPLKSGLVGPTAVAAGSYAMRVETSGPFGVQGLTANEQSKLVTKPQITPVLSAAVQ